MEKHIDVTIAHNYPQREKLNAAKVGRRLLDLMKANKNRLNHSVLLADAQKEDSPLHPAFEWNDGKAAEQYRIQQADLLTRSVTITIRQPESESSNGKPAVVQVSIVSEKQQDRTVYLAQVQTHASYASAPLKKMDRMQEILADMYAFRRKWGEVGLVQPVIAAMEEVMSHAVKGEPQNG